MYECFYLILEYPLQPHDRASWKHRKWKDVHNHKWVSTLPDGYSDSKLSIHYQKERKNLANADNVRNDLISFFIFDTF